MIFPLYDDNPTARTPLFTIALIGVTAAFFLAAMSTEDPDALAAGAGMVPARLFGGGAEAPGALWPPLTLLSYQFLHVDLWHLGGNMLALWVFGDNVEDAMGRFRFAAFYLLTGAAAALVHGASDPASAIPVIGASGAISGLFGAYLLLTPHARVLVLILKLPVTVPAYVMIGVWFVYQLVMAELGVANIAWFAHIGGFLAGMALVWPCKRRGVTLFRPRGDPGALTRWAVKKDRRGLGVWLMKHSIGGLSGVDAAAEAWNPEALRDERKDGKKDP